MNKHLAQLYRTIGRVMHKEQYRNKYYTDKWIDYAMAGASSLDVIRSFDRDIHRKLLPSERNFMYAILWICLHLRENGTAVRFSAFALSLSLLSKNKKKNNGRL